MSEKEVIKYIQDFVSGAITPLQFHKIYNTTSALQDFCKVSKEYSIVEEFGGDLNKYLATKNWKNPEHLYEIAGRFSYVLWSTKNLVPMTPKFSENYEKYATIYPDWLSDDAFDYIEQKIMNKVPKGLTQAQEKKWLKKTIKEVFKYEKRPPEFAQGGEWPLDKEGNPLVFRKQVEKGEEVTYTFVNPKTKEEVQVKELY